MPWREQHLPSESALWAQWKRNMVSARHAVHVRSARHAARLNDSNNARMDNIDFGRVS